MQRIAPARLHCNLPISCLAEQVAYSTSLATYLGYSSIFGNKLVDVNAPS